MFNVAYPPDDLQVGQNGKVVAPQFYISCGVSDAIQPLTYTGDSKVKFVINKDIETLNFLFVGYGLVADLFEPVPVKAAKL